MKVKFFEINLKSSKETEFFNITEQVKEKVKESRIKDGICVVYSKHTTCCIRINEWEESLVEKDFPEFFERTAGKGKEYGHDLTNVDDRPNTHAHLRSMLLNSTETIPLKNGMLEVGKWQSIYFIELDGPREKRTAIVEVIGE